MDEKPNRNGLPYYRRYPRDLIEGTVGLPFEVKTTYGFIIDLIYLHSGRLRDDPRFISGILGCSVRKWNSIRNELVALDKLQIIDGFISNYRADKELEILRSFQDKQAQNARGFKKTNGLEKPAHEPNDQPKLDLPESESESIDKEKFQKKGIRLGDDWQLPADWLKWCLSEYPTVTDAKVRNEALKFKDYWISRPGNSALKIDWLPQWRIWCRNQFGVAQEAQPKATIPGRHLERDRDKALWLECERIRGKPFPTSNMQWWVPQSLIDQASANLGKV